MFRTKFGHAALQDSLECPQVSNSSDRQQLRLLPCLIGLSEPGWDFHWPVVLLLCNHYIPDCSKVVVAYILHFSTSKERERRT